MTLVKQKSIRIHDRVEKNVLSTAQKHFNNLIKKIAAQKNLLAEWQEAIPRYQHLVNSQYHPLLAIYNNQRGELVYLLDNAYHNNRFKHVDRAKIQHIIVNLTQDLIAGHGKDELKELYNKHSASDFDADNQAQDAAVVKAMKAALRDLYGIEIGVDEDVSSPEKMQAILQEKLQKKQDEKAEKQRLSEEKLNNQPQTVAEREAEERQKEDEKNLSKSIQAVFRQLAAALHPDREQDETERERKTKLMQQVNVAYDKKDLLRLLELQLEVEQIKQSELDNIAEQRLKYFNKILQAQFDELRDAIVQLTQSFKRQQNHSNLTPKKVLGDLEMNIRNMQHNISRLKADIDTFQSPVALKSWLKNYRM